MVTKMVSPQPNCFSVGVSSLPSLPVSHSCFCQEVELTLLPPAEENWA